MTCCATWRTRVSSKPRRCCRVVVHDSAQRTLSGDPELLRRAVENVVRNAIRYAPPQSEVELRAEDGTGALTISVRDSGAGVPEDLLSQLAQPFFRVEDANPLEYQNGIPQALRLMNSPFTAKSDLTAAQIVGSAKTPAESIERIYMAALSRRPTARELERLTTYVNRPGSTPRTAYGDILWALMNSSEFVLNH